MKNHQDRYITALEHVLGVPFFRGNAVRALRNGDEIFPAMLAAIRGAQDNINFLTFVYWTGAIAEEFAEALSERARAGVRVRVLLDAYGAKAMPDALSRRMAEAGVDVQWFRPLATFRFWRVDKRTHRKILTVDHAVGFTGGVGIAEEWSGDAQNPSEWRETHFRISGPAVHGLHAAFLDNWTEAAGWTFDEPPHSAPDTVAAAPVQIIFPGEHTDQRLPQLAGAASVERLLRAGVAFFRYDRTLLHAKLMIVDDILNVIGSANLNHRSTGKDEECCAAVVDADLAAQLSEHFRDDLQHATPLRIEQWAARSMFRRCQERLARLLVEQL